MKMHCYMLAIALIFPVASQAATQYIITPLPGPGGAESMGTAISTFGVGGESLTLSPDSGLLISNPTLWQGGQSTLLSVPSGYTGGISQVNATGDVVGAVHDPNVGSPQPILWHNGQMQLLDTLGMANGVAYGINDGGAVVGEIDDLTTSHAVVWTNGQATTIADFSRAISINNSGQVLVSGQNNSQSGDWIWLNGVATVIPGISGGLISSHAMNNLGHITGATVVTDDAPIRNAFFYKDGVSTILPLFSEDVSSEADGLNDFDQVVGAGRTLLDDSHALLWQDGEVFDLNSLIPQDSGWALTGASAIDNAGDIVGTGVFNGQMEAFLLTPIVGNNSAVPEPATAAVLMVGVSMLLRRRVRRM